MSREPNRLQVIIGCAVALPALYLLLVLILGV